MQYISSNITDVKIIDIERYLRRGSVASPDSKPRGSISQGTAAATAMRKDSFELDVLKTEQREDMITVTDQI